MTDLAHGFDLSLFREPQRARRDLDQLRALLPEGILDDLFRLLPDCPDPDQALNLFERLAAQRSGHLSALLEINRVLLHYLVALFGHSYWLGEALLHNPDLIASLAHDRHLDRPREKEDYREGLARFVAQSGPADISAPLARFRKREYVRIALRDVLGLATLA
ncbi:MAG TPA: hypothetical protein VFL42_05520, partial [Terriglobales bacterium]|nr:hypothetical protein [Terriglobales bacterium]